jgi:hypothetical protein
MPKDNHPLTQPAQVAELVDALASGASFRKEVEVRVLSWAPLLLLEAVVFQAYHGIRAPPETQIGTHWGHFAWFW